MGRTVALLVSLLAVGAAEVGAGEVESQPLVVIDPGHGGSNSGAPGAVAGVQEKQLTLALSRCVAGALRESGSRVVLTRTDDRYVSLRSRVRRANRLGAEMFVSIHANASPEHTRRGYETYILTPQALDVDARALRVEDGPERPSIDLETRAVLDDVERGIALPAAAELAAAIQEQLRKVRDPDDDRGVRQAPMHVLLGAHMPAVLVEIGFIDHPLEGPELLQPEVEASICDALARAIAGRMTAR